MFVVPQLLPQPVSIRFCYWNKRNFQALVKTSSNIGHYNLRNKFIVNSPRGIRNLDHWVRVVQHCTGLRLSGQRGRLQEHNSVHAKQGKLT